MTRNGMGTACSLCLNRDNSTLVEATRTVKNLRVCDEHAPMVEFFEGSDLAALITGRVTP